VVIEHEDKDITPDRPLPVPEQESSIFVNFMTIVSVLTLMLVFSFVVLIFYRKCLKGYFRRRRSGLSSQGTGNEIHYQ
jgi:hypothetical protein